MLRFKARPRKDPTESPFLTPSQRRIMKAMRVAMEKVRRGAERNEGKLLDAILHGPPSRLDALVPEDPWYEAQAEMQEELRIELLAAGNRYGAMIPAVQKAKVNFRFDEARPEAAAWAAKEAGNMIVEVVEEQRALVRDLASRASMGEMTPRDAARGIRDTIGLTNQQAGWVENFRARQVADLQTQGLSAAEVARRADKATQRYHDRIHRYRSENIARTEILRASHEGRQQAWQQGLDEGYISPNSEKQWSANQDGRVCDECSFLDGITVPLSGTFPGGEPPLHPSCRCDVLLIPLQPTGIQELQGLSDAELDEQIAALTSGETPVPVAVAPQGQPAYSSAFATGARSFNDIDSGPRWGNEKFAKWQDTVEADNPSREALYDYTSENYKNYNSALRSGDLADSPDAFGIFRVGDILDTATVPEDVIAVRGITTGDLPADIKDLYDNLKPGSVIHDAGFSSTSLAPRPAIGGDVTLRIRVPAGTKGAYLGRLSKYRDMEQELLLQSGTTYRVVEVHEVSAFRKFVDVEVVNQEFGATSPPGSLAKAKRRPPTNSVISEDGELLRFGGKFIVDGADLVIVNP